ncbi:MAG: 23S rRNA (uracil(1939)-C(5))-methyltransferase RlmD [Anaerorhabdus sp.]
MKNIKIIKTGINGEGIGYDNKTPVFIEGALVDEIVDVDQITKYQRYKKGVVCNIRKSSIDRKEPECKIQKRCGGCSLMISKYDNQLDIKKSLVKEALIKYARVNPRLVEDVVASDEVLEYRNQCKLPVKWLKGTLYSGMYKPQTNHLVYMDKCLIHDKELDRVRKDIMDILNKFEIRDYNEKIERGLRNFVLRGFEDEFQCTLVTGKMRFDQKMIDEILNVKGLVSLFQNINFNSKSYEVFSNEFIHLGGKKKLALNFKDKRINLSPASFFQLNKNQAEKLYDKVIDLLKPSNFIVEAYSGVGIISLLSSFKAKKVLGIESNSAAVKNAKENAKINHIDNVDFICGDAATVLNDRIKEKIDTLIVDPPRSGLDDNIIDTLLRIKPRSIIYISCNPATLGKNINELSYEYNVDSVTPFDMFPQTPHVESVVLMSRVGK